MAAGGLGGGSGHDSSSTTGGATMGSIEVGSMEAGGVVTVDSDGSTRTISYTTITGKYQYKVKRT